MSWLAKKPSIATLDGLFDRYATVLEDGPVRGGTVHHISELPGDKSLMKAVLLAKAYELGNSADDILRAGFTSLANFRPEQSEPAERHFQIAAEMQELTAEWQLRVRYADGGLNA